MSKIIKIIIGLIIIIIIVWAIAAGGKSGKEEGPIKIGFVGPLTGDAANVGQNAKAAVELAVDEVNAAGGINGRPLEVVYEDGQCSGEAANAANKLINIDKVPLIFGGACSGETMSFVKNADQSKTVVLSYCSSVPTLTSAGDYIFRDYPSDSFQGKFTADYIFQKLGKKKVAIMYVKTDWGTGIKEVFSEEFKNIGGEVVLSEGFDQNSKDMRTLLAKVKASNPEIVYFLGYSNESIVALTQAKDVGLKTSWFGGDAWDDSKIWTTVGAAGEGAMYSYVSSSPNDAFKAAMKAKIGNDEIAACTPTAYDGIKVLAQVMKKVGADATAIKDEFYKTVYTGGVSAEEISFDSNGDLKVANYSVKKIKEGVAEVIQ